MTESPAIVAWIWFLRAISVFNVAVWLQTAVIVRREAPMQGPDLRGYRRRQLSLAALFVFGCAFRAIWPRADVQRICLFDTWLSFVVVGRAVATIAELAFMSQWALLLGESAGPGQRDVARVVSRILVPIIGLAEVSSWYAVVSTNFLGNGIEQSIWTFSSALVVVALLSRERGARQRFAGIATALIGAYIVFMSTVDVPMYLRRWQFDEQAGHPYLSFIDGIRDVSFRRVVTRDWAPWRHEIPWMSLYFRAGVWVSLWLVRTAPAKKTLSVARGSVRQDRGLTAPLRAG